MLLTNAASRSIQLRSRASPFGVTLRSSLLMNLAFPHCPVSTEHLTFRLKASFDRTFSFLGFLLQRHPWCSRYIDSKLPPAHCLRSSGLQRSYSITPLKPFSLLLLGSDLFRPFLSLCFATHTNSPVKRFPSTTNPTTTQTHDPPTQESRNKEICRFPFKEHFEFAVIMLLAKSMITANLRKYHHNHETLKLIEMTNVTLPSSYHTVSYHWRRRKYHLARLVFFNITTHHTLCCAL